MNRHPHLTPALSPPSEGAEREKMPASQQVRGFNARIQVRGILTPALSPSEGEREKLIPSQR